MYNGCAVIDDLSAYLGYLKYHGDLVEGGMMDAGKAARALLSFDSSLRFLLTSQTPELAELQFEIPDKIESDSWLAYVPASVGKWAIIALGSAATMYLKTAAKHMAKKDFEGVGLRDLFAKALERLQWIVRIAKHLGNTKQREFHSLELTLVADR